MTQATFSRWPGLAEAQAYYQTEIDTLAGQVRERFARDWLIDEEYMLAARQAQDYADRDYADPVPEAVQAWADAAGMTAKSAADDILATRDAYNAALLQIRRLRLVAKQSISAAADVRSAYDLYAQARSDLDAIGPS